jgi:hypothetical protein
MLTQHLSAPRSSTQRSSRAWLVVLTIGVVLAPILQLRLVEHLDNGAWPDLYSPWFGSQAALHGQDPYSPVVTEQIQRQIYGHVLAPTESWDREAFVYPAFIVLFLGPFTALPWPFVHLLFALLAPPAVALTAWCWLRICRPNFRRRTGVIAMLLILASWPSVWGYFQCQPSLFVLAALSLAVLFFRCGWDIPAGILLAAAAVKPQLMILLVPWLVLLALSHRRWRLIAAFFAAGAVLVGASLAIVPGWIPRWIHAGRAYARYPAKIPLLVFLSGRTLGSLLAAALVLALALRLWKLRRIPVDSPEFAQSAALVLAATACIIPGNPWLVFNNLLLIPAVFVLADQQPLRAVPALLQSVAGLVIGLALISTVFCAALGAFLGFNLALVMIPFLLSYVLPVPVAAALLAVPQASPRPVEAAAVVA